MTALSTAMFELPMDKMSHDLPAAHSACSSSCNSSCVSSDELLMEQSAFSDDVVKENYSSDQTKETETSACDACRNCDDVCTNMSCEACYARRENAKDFQGTMEQRFTMCQVRRHNTKSSAWLVAGNSVYDATPFLQCHPAGSECIMKKSGGVADCTMDIQFHGKRGQMAWKRAYIGKLVPCGCDQQQNVCKPWKFLWFR